MLTISGSESAKELCIEEACGLAHALQVVELPLPWPAGDWGAWRDSVTGNCYPIQRARQHPGQALVLLELQPFQRLCLSPVVPSGAAAGPAAAAAPVQLREEAGSLFLSNGCVILELDNGQPPAATGATAWPGPLRAFGRVGGPRRGRTFFDTTQPLASRSLTVLEAGPLRGQCRYRAEFAGGGRYEAVITLDAGQCFARFDEVCDSQAQDQLVWDFAAADLPAEVRLLDATEGFRPIVPNPFLDNRIARLFAWTQGSQLFDLVDGFGLRFAPGDEIGFVTLAGGRWEGGRLNHLELWVRRWVGADAGSRRTLPPEAKADANPSPELVPARGTGQTRPHLCVEAWLGRGRRSFALAAAALDACGYAPDAAMRQEPDPFERRLPAGAGHFVSHLDQVLSRGQYYLRQLQIQRGMMPLQEQLAMVFVWPEDGVAAPAFGWRHPALAGQSRRLAAGTERDQALALLEYLRARVHGFWTISGAAFSNPVSGREVAPGLFLFEALAARGVLTPAEWRLGRALFAFLAYYYASDHFYPGRVTMLPVEDPDSFEPTIAGMCNQNFHTDAFTVAGAAAQVFPGHPAAGAWRELFGGMLRRQLAYHCYPASGVWEESHTYYHHVLATLFPVLARRRADGIDDGFADPAFQKLAGYVLKLVTPGDEFAAGKRHVTPLGDHGAESDGAGKPAPYRRMYAHYAEAFASAAPLLAAHLAWLHRETGGQGEGLCLPAPLAPAWRDEAIQGLGYFFRSRDAGGNEELLALRCGQAWGHHHQDDGSLQFYARGRTWITDAAFGEVAARGQDKFEAAGHSRWLPKGSQPLHYLWRFNRGWIAAHGESAGRAWALAYAPVAMTMPAPGVLQPLRSLCRHCRLVLRLAPGAYLVVDALPLPEENVVRYHVPAAGAELRQAGNVVQVRAGAEALDLAALPVAAGRIGLGESRPAEPAKALRLATLAIEFDCGPGCLAVSAFACRRAEALPLRLERQPRGAEIAAAGRRWQLDLSEPGLMVLAAAGEPELRLPLAAPAAEPELRARETVL